MRMGQWVKIIGATAALAAIAYSVKPSLAVLTLFIPPAYAVFAEAQRSARIRGIEAELPRALLELAALPTHGLRDVVKHLSRGYGPLSEEFQRARKMIAKGIPPEKAMQSVARASGSELLVNAVNIIVTGAQSGSRWSDLLRGAAENVEAVIGMERERNAALSLQKYVTMASAGIFVPATLGITRRMVVRLAYGGGPFGGNALLEASLHAAWIHVTVLAILSAAFIALLEGRPGRGLFYGAILVPMAVVTYVLMGGMQI